MNVKLSDIARLVNIGKGSVSRVLRGDPRANELRTETRRKILETAHQLGYKRDDFAAAMTTGKANVSGFLVQYGYSEYTARILNGMLEEAGKFDHLITLISVTPSTSMEEITDFCVRQRMTALTTYNSLSDSERLRQLLLEHNILLVQIGSDQHFPEVEGIPFPYHHAVLISLMKRLRGTPFVETNAPGAVEATLFDQPEQKRLLLSLLNLPLELPPLPVHDLTIRLNLPEKYAVKSMFLAPEDVPVPFESKGHSLEIKMNKLEEFALFTLQY